MKQLSSGLLLPTIDYCNIILAGLPKPVVGTLPRVQNAAARMVMNLRPRDNILDGLHASIVLASH